MYRILVALNHDAKTDTEWAILFSIVGFVWITYAWETYLDYRQHQLYKSVINIPPNIAVIMDQDTFTRARLYSLDHSWFDFLSNLYSTVQITLVIYFSSIAYLWEISVQHANFLGISRNWEITISMLFIFYFSFLTFIDALPWKFYRIFYIEEKYGFNNQTIIFYLKDRLKSFIFDLLFTLPIIASFLFIIKVGGPFFYFYAWLFSLVMGIFMMFIYPDLIAPMFDRYVPLPEGELKSLIEQLSNCVQFPLTKILVVEGSKRSNHSNAYFYGFGSNKRIVLYDTLLEDFDFPEDPEDVSISDDNAVDTAEFRTAGVNNAEVIAVLGHELGHWKLGHITYTMILNELNLLFLMFAFGQLFTSEVLFSSFNFTADTIPAPIIIRLLIIFQFVFLPLNTLEELFGTILSRKFEFEADEFAVKLHKGDDLKSALIRLERDNLGFPVTDWLYSTYYFSHPPLIERLCAIEKCQSKYR